jgi:hypothetical protein
MRHRLNLYHYPWYRKKNNRNRPQVLEDSDDEAEDEEVEESVMTIGHSTRIAKGVCKPET